MYSHFIFKKGEVIKIKKNGKEGIEHQTLFTIFFYSKCCIFIVFFVVANQSNDCNIVIGSQNGCKRVKATSTLVDAPWKNGLLSNGNPIRWYLLRKRIPLQEPWYFPRVVLVPALRKLSRLQKLLQFKLQIPKRWLLDCITTTSLFACHCSCVGFWTCSGKVVIYEDGCACFDMTGSQHCQ